MKTMDIVLENIRKAFDGRIVLDDVSMVLPEGKVSCIMAPSGRGKTTLLKILMGVEQADSGKILGLEGKRRSVVFQEDRLCGNLTPVSNIRLVSPKLKEETVLSAMEKAGLSGCENQPVTELSGGMRRRVSILRALLAEYDLLLLDEPFKGLDAETKAQVIADAKERCRGKTTLLVTHDAAEAWAMGAVQIIEM